MKVFIVLSLLVALACAEPPSYRQQNQQQRRYYFARQEEETTPVAPAEAPYPASGWKPDGPAFELPQKQFKNTYEPSPDFGSKVERKYGAPDNSQAQDNSQDQQRFGSSEFQTRQQQQQRQFSASQNQYQQRQYLQPFGYQPQVNQYGAPEPQEQFQPPKPDQEYGVPFTTTEEPSTTTETEDATTTSSPQTDSEVEPVNAVNELDEEGDLDDQQSEQQGQKGEYYVALPDGRLQRIQYVSRQDVEAMKYFARIRAENVEPLRGPIYSYAPLQELQFAPASLQIAPASPAVSSTGSESSSVSTKSGKLELQEEEATAEAAPFASPPLAAVVQYSYGSPAAASAYIPFNAASSYSANYRVQNQPARYILSF